NLAADPKPALDFNRDIRPILSDTCFKCHGPDDKQRKAKLRLDVRESALAVKSELLDRIATDDEGPRMPPVKSGKRLKPEKAGRMPTSCWSIGCCRQCATANAWPWNGSTPPATPTPTATTSTAAGI